VSAISPPTGVPPVAFTPVSYRTEPAGPRGNRSAGGCQCLAEPTGGQAAASRTAASASCVSDASDCAAAGAGRGAPGFGGPMTPRATAGETASDNRQSSPVRNVCLAEAQDLLTTFHAVALGARRGVPGPVRKARSTIGSKPPLPPVEGLPRDAKVPAGPRDVPRPLACLPAIT
jgi:hypothetical protein